MAPAALVAIALAALAKKAALYVIGRVRVLARVRLRFVGTATLTMVAMAS